MIADDPEGRHDWYNPGDTLTIVFSEPTNLAGLPVSGLSKPLIDLLFEFSEPLGAAYSAKWKCGRSSQALCKDWELYADPSAPRGTPVTLPSRPDTRNLCTVYHVEGVMIWFSGRVLRCAQLRSTRLGVIRFRQAMKRAQL